MSRRAPRQDVCDLYGNRLYVRYFQRGGSYAFSLLRWEPEPDTKGFTQMSSPQEVVAPHDQDHRTAHYLRILLDAYRPVLTAKQFEAIEQVIVLRRSLRELAAERGGSAEAWRQRIDGTRGHGGIKEKAPALYAIWLMRNRGRRDISEVINAIHRAIAHHASKPIHDTSASTEAK